mgnify:FL=1
MQYFQRAKEQNKTKEEVRADLNGRLKKLRKLQSEEILKNDFEKKLVRNEIHQIQNLLTWMQIYPPQMTEMTKSPLSGVGGRSLKN